MIIYPAIDMRQGKCVRLLQGEASRETIYFDDPVSVAVGWEAEGAQWLHLVDLDGAMTTDRQNRVLAKQIFRSLKIPVQFGGGLRRMEDLEEIFSAGVSRAILGTAAVENQKFLMAALERFGDGIGIGIDARHGQVATRGWQQLEALSALDFAKSLATLGARRLVFTDISRDGMLGGSNMAATRQVAEASGLAVIASGGISSLDDLRQLKTLETSGVEGVIVGKALYERKFTLAEAMAAVR
jgi:phosphoribosylformimino-5-aminoimidazole carboxamide ribotide isomerase